MKLLLFIAFMAIAFTSCTSQASERRSTTSKSNSGKKKVLVQQLTKSSLDYSYFNASNGVKEARFVDTIFNVSDTITLGSKTFVIVK